jgi:hypothetical protein
MLGILAARVRTSNAFPSIGRAHPIAPPSHVAKHISSSKSIATAATWLWIYDEITVKRMSTMRPEKHGVAPLYHATRLEFRDFIRKKAKKLGRLSWAYSKNKPSKPLKRLILYFLYLVDYLISQTDNP